MIEVYNDITDEWGTVCGEVWTPEDSMVACRQHGFPGSSDGA